MDEDLWELVAGLRNQRNRKESDIAKEKQEEVLTAEKLMQIGRETRKFVLATMPPEQRLAGLAPEQRLAGLAPEQRLAGLTAEEVTMLMKEIEAFLSQPKSSDQ